MKAQLPKTYVELHRKMAWQINLWVSGSAILLLALFPSPVFAANDLLTGKLRVDRTEVNQSDDYIMSIQIGGFPDNGNSVDFTAAFLGLSLDPQLTVFEQVGFKTNSLGPYWFVEVFNAQITCFQGTLRTWDSTHAACEGDAYERASIGNWHRVELVTYPNQGSFWIARVSDQYGNPLDVARIDYSGGPTNVVYSATASSEEGYVESTDPFLIAYFWHGHPKYWIGGTGDPFIEWPASDGTNNNFISPSPSGICPKHYYAKFNWQGDPRVWYAGSKTQGPGVCSGHMF